MRIVKLLAENVKKLQAVNIEPDGSIVTIRGNNNQGKSSVLDSIWYALGGEKSHPEMPIRQGQSSAKVRIETDSGLVIERKWTASGTKLEVKSSDGAKYPSPQKILDGLVGSLSFDPLAFLRESPKKQAETLRQISGIDTSLLDFGRQKAFDVRTNVNREVSALRARLASLPAVDAPDEPVSAAQLLEEQNSRQAIKTNNDEKRRKLDRLRSEFRDKEQVVAIRKTRIVDLEEQLRSERERLTEEQKALDIYREKGSTLRSEVEALVDPDMAEIPARVREIESTNDLVRKKKVRAEVASQLHAREVESAELSKEIGAIDVQKEDMLKSASYPVEGLGFSENGVTLNDLPFSQASASEQLRVSVAMGAAANPKLRVMLVRDGSLLDQDSLRLLSEMAEEQDLQIWIEMVGKGGAGVVIEDGLVVD